MANLRRQLADAHQRNRDLRNQMHQADQELALPLRARVAELERALERMTAERDQYRELYFGHKVAMESVVVACYQRMLASGKGTKVEP